MKQSWLHIGSVQIKVTKNHLAFLRGYLEGLDIIGLGERYLHTSIGGKTDGRIIKSQLNWIREQLVVAAHRRGRDFRDVRLIKIAPEKLQQTNRQPMMSLDEFRDERNLHDFPEADVLQLFQEEFDTKATRREIRNDRLRRRQLAALSQLELLISADPCPDDAVDGWLDPALAQRLSNAGIRTLRDLSQHINQYGYRWFSKVPRIGEKAALLINDWMSSTYVSSSTGLHIETRALSPARKQDKAGLMRLRPRVTGIVPMEALLVPQALSGEHGSNRGRKCLIHANNDYAAIQEWLNTQSPNLNTRRAYQREAERYLLWSVVELQRPISDHTSADCVSYRTFLRHIGRTHQEDGQQIVWPFRLSQGVWIGLKQAGRYTLDWRPFAGPLSRQSQEYAIGVVRSLCDWLTGRRYLESNPWDGVPKLGLASPRRFDRTRSFSFGQWKVLLRYLETMQKDDAYDRLRFTLLFAYGTGLRVSELVQACVRDIERVTDTRDQSESYVINVIGKGQRPRQVPIPQKVMAEVHRYLARRGLSSILECHPAVPLIGRLGVKKDSSSLGINLPSPTHQSGIFSHAYTSEANMKHVTPNALYVALKEFFRSAARSIDVLDPHTRRLFYKASMHWLRHTCGTHAVAYGVPLGIVQANFGHTSPNTTAGYTEQDTFERARAMNKFVDSALTLGEDDYLPDV